MNSGITLPTGEDLTLFGTAEIESPCLWTKTGRGSRPVTTNHDN